MNSDIASAALKHIDEKLSEEKKDPNVDLFIATLKSDVKRLRSALERNANPNISLDSVFDKYSVELQDFKPSTGGTLWKPG